MRKFNELLFANRRKIDALNNRKKSYREKLFKNENKKRANIKFALLFYSILKYFACG
jgi:hypothetical protein